MNKSIISLAAALSLTATIHAGEEVNHFGTDTEVCDVCLIYSGDASRPTWDADHLRPYLTHKYADGHREWFYDGFLFLEFRIGKAQLANASAGQQAAVQSEWLQYLDNLFEEDHDLHQLDRMISEYKKELGEPAMRHKVIIATCCPAKDGSQGGAEWRDINWGEVNGEKMNFALKSHRVKATEWFIDEIVQRFNDAKFENIDLAGLYWIEETLFSNSDIIATINKYIHNKGLRSYWIPYWVDNNQWAHEWSTYKFDMAWRQPNYFFYNRDMSLPPYSQLTEAIEDSKKFGLGLELEFETQATSNGMHEVSPTMHSRIHDYMDEFEKQGVWESAGVAHYTGTQGLYHMAQSTDPVNQATIDKLARFVAKRHENWAGIQTPEVADSVQFAYPGEGEIYITPDAPNAICYNFNGVAVHHGDGRFKCPEGFYIVCDGNGNSSKVMVR